MVGNMLMVLGAEPQIISPGTVTLIIRMFATLARVSPSIALSLLQNGIIDTLKSMLRGADGESGADGLSDGADGSFHGPLSPRSPRYAAGASAAGSGVSRSPEQMFEILALANYLLPHLSFDLPSDLFAPVPAPSLFNGLGRGMGSHVRAMPELRAPESRTEAENDRIAARTSLFDEHPNILYNFASSLLGVFVRIFGASLNPNVKYRCLAATLKVRAAEVVPVCVFLCDCECGCECDWACLFVCLRASAFSVCLFFVMPTQKKKKKKKKKLPDRSSF